MDRVRCSEQCYGLYKTLGNSYKNIEKLHTKTMREKGAVFMIADTIADKGLLRMGKVMHAEEPGHEVQAHITRTDARRTIVSASPTFQAAKKEAAKERDAARQRQNVLDVKKGKQTLKRRFPYKRPQTSSDVRSLKRPSSAHRARPSQEIFAKIEGAIRQLSDDDID